MAIVQLGAQGKVAAPPSPFLLELNAPDGVVLRLRDAEDRETIIPRHRLNDRRVIVSVDDRGLSIGAARADGQPFEPAVMVGVTISSLQTPDDHIVRTQIDAGGRPHVRLVRTAVLDSVASLIDAHDVAFEPQPDVDKESSDEGGVSQDRPTIASTPRFASRPAAAIEQRDWHRRGGYAYHAGHESAAQSGAWAMVIDGSASMRVRDQGEVARLLEAIIGITIAARLGGPESVGVTRLNGSRELGPDLDHDVADWSTLFSGAPSPWSQVTPAVRAAAQQVGPGGLVVLVVDGTPVDALDLVGWSKENPERIELHVVALGRSGSKHREALRWWEDELVVLAPLREAGHRLVAIDGPAAVADHPTELADDLYPRERG